MGGLLGEGEEALFLLGVEVRQVGEGGADEVGLGPVELGDEAGGEVHEAVGGLNGGGSVGAAVEGLGEGDVGRGVFGVGFDDVLKGGLGFDAVTLEEGGDAAFDPGIDRVGVFLHQAGEDILTMGVATATDEEASEFEFVLEGGLAEGAEAIEEADGVFGLLLGGGMGEGAQQMGPGVVVLEDGDETGEGFAGGGGGSLGDDLLGLTIGLPGSDSGLQALAKSHPD